MSGRTGRLNQHFVGNAYYLKAPTDPQYKRLDAIRSIKFEITDDSKDVDIQKGNIEKYPDVLAFLNELGISIEEYHINIGSRSRFETVKAIYTRYKENRDKLIDELQQFRTNPQHGRLNLVKLLFEIIEGKRDPFKSNIINNLLNRQRLKIKTVVDEVRKYFGDRGIDNIISTTISMKSSYIEHQFYPKTILVRYFLLLSHTNSNLLEILDSKIIGSIEFLYFATSKQKKMLVDLGIYERDVDVIIRAIGEDYEDTFELKRRLITAWDKLQGISFISKYVIQSLI